VTLVPTRRPFILHHRAIASRVCLFDQVGGTEGRVGYLGDLNLRLATGESLSATVGGNGASYIAKNAQGLVVTTWKSKCGTKREHYLVSDVSAHTHVDL
jgi:hypothetical protein